MWYEYTELHWERFFSMHLAERNIWKDESIEKID